ncbi:MAG: ATP-binding cassette domain-containing protein [Bacilli bacterium]|jgi:oligopeptide transport system ATP-binding protein
MNYENREIVLSLKNVRQYFSSGFGKRKIVVKAVHNVSFDVYKGEVFGLVGESGCGKTTTGRSIIKLYNITDGEIFFNGVRISAGIRSNVQRIKDARKAIKMKKAETKALIADIKTDSAAQSDNDIVNRDVEKVQEDLNKFIAEQEEIIQKERQEIREKKKDNKLNKKLMSKMAMIFQDPIDSLNPRMTVREIISEGMIIHGIKDKEYIDQKVKEALRLVGLVEEHATRYPHEFSGGQRQRIGIARALVVNPDLIIADEPISALDVSIQAQVINLLNDLRKQFNLTILFIAHNLSVVKYFCDRIGVMYYGRLVEIAPAEELFANPLHPYTKSLLSAVPLPDPEYEKNRKRLYYVPHLRKFTQDKPKMVEITPGHFVLGSQEEIARYRDELAGKPVPQDPTLIEVVE